MDSKKIHSINTVWTNNIDCSFKRKFQNKTKKLKQRWKTIKNTSALCDIWQSQRFDNNYACNSTTYTHTNKKKNLKQITNFCIKTIAPGATIARSLMNAYSNAIFLIALGMQLQLQSKCGKVVMLCAKDYQCRMIIYTKKWKQKISNKKKSNKKKSLRKFMIWNRVW